MEKIVSNVEKLPVDWTIHEVWNAAFLNRKKRAIEPRSHIWASELGKAPIDVILKLRGVEPTNEPDERAIRKMEAGNYFEYLVKLVLIRAGILHSSQTRVEVEREGLLKVTGRLDFIGGGVPNIKEAENILEEEDAPETLKQSVYQVVDYLLKKYPNGLGKKIIEVKSLSAIAFEKIRNGKPIFSHAIQAYHYVYGEGIPVDILYLCRDDMRMITCHLNRNEEMDAEYTAIVNNITTHYNLGTTPENENLIIFDEFECKFSRNFNVQYSSYLTMLYGYEKDGKFVHFQHPEEYADYVAKIIGRWNRVLGRMKRNEKMTPNNLEAIEEMRQHGFDVDIIIKKFTPDIEVGVA